MSPLNENGTTIAGIIVALMVFVFLVLNAIALRKRPSHRRDRFKMMIIVVFILTLLLTTFSVL